MASKKKLPAMVFSTSPSTALPPYSFTTNPPRAQLPGFSVTPHGPVANVAPVAPPGGGALPGFSVQPAVPTKTVTPVVPPPPSKLVNKVPPVGKVVNTAKEASILRDYFQDREGRTNLDQLKRHRALRALVKNSPNVSKRLDRSYKYETAYMKNRPSGSTPLGFASDDLVDELQQLARPGISDREAVRMLESMGGAVRPPGILNPRAEQKSEYANQVTSAYSGLNEVARDTFLSLLPEWNGTIQSLANAAKELSK